MVGPTCDRCGGTFFGCSHLERPGAADIVFVHCTQCGHIAGLVVDSSTAGAFVQAKILSTPQDPVYVSDADKKGKDLMI